MTAKRAKASPKTWIPRSRALAERNKPTMPIRLTTPPPIHCAASSMIEFPLTVAGADSSAGRFDEIAVGMPCGVADQRQHDGQPDIERHDAGGREDDDQGRPADHDAPVFLHC